MNKYNVTEEDVEKYEIWDLSGWLLKTKDVVVAWQAFVGNFSDFSFVQLPIFSAFLTTKNKERLFDLFNRGGGTEPPALEKQTAAPASAPHP